MVISILNLNFLDFDAVSHWFYIDLDYNVLVPYANMNHI